MSKQEQKPEIKLPEDFRRKLLEVVDPSQSCDYYEMGDLVFPVRVLPIGFEKKFLRIYTAFENNFSLMIQRSAGELCHFYYPDLKLDWPTKNCREEDIAKFHLIHQEKCNYNDEVVDVVNQVITQIDWKPADKEKTSEFRRYVPSHVFLPIFMYLNVIENVTIDYILKNMTRGLLEIVKLNNLITNDRMRQVESKKAPAIRDEEQQRMTDAQTLDEFMSGLAKQGFSAKDLL